MSSLMADAANDNEELDYIPYVPDGLILAAFHRGRRDIEINHDECVELSGGDISQLDIDVDG